MSRLLLLASLAVLVATLALWVGRGAHPGWSRSQTPVANVDEVTGLEYTTYVKRWTPGLDFLAAGVLAAAVLAAGGVVVARRRRQLSSS